MKFPNLKNEPVVVAEATKIAVALAVIFGLDLDADTALVVIGAVYAGPSLVVRQFVFPKNKVEVLTEDAGDALDRS
jgi:hypothetical protein